MAKVTEIDACICWTGSNGFGQYTIWTDENGNLKGDSEYMDNGDRKEFLKSLFESILEQIEIVG